MFSELQQATQITDNLEHKVSLSLKGDKFFLEVRYMDGKFVINKTFQNNYQGKLELNQQIEELDTEEKVRAYLNL